MSPIKQRITEDIKSAMRDKDKDLLGTLRMITAAIKQKEVDERIELDDKHVLAILDKLAKQHRESIQQYEQAGRNDLVEKEKSELAVVQKYLPEQLGEAEVNRLIESAISEAGATSMKDMGKVMGLLKPRIQGRADMASVSEQVKSSLEQS